MGRKARMRKTPYRQILQGIDTRMRCGRGGFV